MEAKTDGKEQRERLQREYKASLNTFKDSRKSGLKKPKSDQSDRILKKDKNSWLVQIVKSELLEVFLDTVYNRK